MGLKNLFGGSRRKNKGGRVAREDEYTVDDLIVLERYSEAEGRLTASIKTNPKDLRAHLKLADVYLAQRKGSKAVDEYVFVAEEYAADGFFDKGIALLSKVYKLMPQDENLPLKIDRIKQRKRLEQMRDQAMEGLREGMGGRARGGTSALELESMWNLLVRSTVVRFLTGEQLKILFRSMTLEHSTKDKLLAEPGDRQESLFLVLRGSVVAEWDAGGQTHQLRTFSSGDIFGETAVLEKSDYPCRFRSADNTALLRLTRSGFERALVGNPDPRRLIEALREQSNDHAVKKMVLSLN
ncbi:MAG: cyclic nucleotide-binding domain-containing protein [Acidobacteriota bacterium]